MRTPLLADHLERKSTNFCNCTSIGDLLTPKDQNTLKKEGSKWKYFLCGTYFKTKTNSKFIRNIVFYLLRYPMEMHMVHVNTKYVMANGQLDGGYATEADGLAVIGFLFKMDPRKVKCIHEL